MGSQPVSVKITIYDLSTGAAASSFCEPNGNYTSNCSETDDDDYVTCTIPAGKAAFLDCFDCAVQYCQVTASEPTVRATFAAFLGGDTPSAILQLQQQ